MLLPDAMGYDELITWLKRLSMPYAGGENGTAGRFWWPHGGRGPLWQRSSYDRVIRYNDAVDEAVWYTLRNPVRKGLVETWEQYPYAGIMDPW